MGAKTSSCECSRAPPTAWSLASVTRPKTRQIPSCSLACLPFLKASTRDGRARNTSFDTLCPKSATSPGRIEDLESFKYRPVASRATKASSRDPNTPSKSSPKITISSIRQQS
eukprot:GHVN01084452.1.p1 GENE.GHVN01084452.1~~GHVN01084452.1.p1  ORF type:complete len:113 (+),score=3.92 GHVN01084452.1:192-530(+)